jgi:ABC-type Zn uptake system ZnuABC Zn-binding protein ZnuA
MENKLMSLQISEDLVKPVIEAKIKATIIEALGGKDQLLEGIMKQVFNQKVSDKGTVSSYSSDNIYNWFDVVITNILQEEVRKAVVEAIKLNSEEITATVEKYIKSNKGTSQIAKALVEAMNGTFSNSYRSNFKIEFEKRRD